MRDFGTMKSNVGADVQDTSTAMAVIIGRYINKRYFDILRLSNWQAVNDSHTITVSGTTMLATLPSNFGKELYCLNNADSTNMYRIDFEEVARATPATDNYAIFSDQNGARQVKIWDSAGRTLKMPYSVKPAELSATTDTPIIPCESIIEAGAIADCWRYKRQFSKAQAMEVMYADMLSNFIWDYENQPAYAKQFYPTTYSRDLL